MTTTNKSEATALVLSSLLQTPAEFVRSEAEKRTNEIVRHSLETAKYEARNLTRHLVQILPPLTGQYAVGCAHLAIERPQTPHLIGDHRIAIEIYAPTKNTDGKKLLMQRNPWIEKSLGREFSEEQLQELYTHSQDGINPIGNWPIVIFSNGMGCDPAEYRLLLEQLASHGYLVLNLNHPSSSSTLFENLDEESADAIYRSRNPEELASKQADNIGFIIEEIRNGRLQALGQAENIILAGHSLGGAASIMAARNDRQIKGCINLDGALKGSDSKTAPSPTPALLISADHRTDTHWNDEFLKEWHEFSSRSQNVGILTIEDTDHLDFGMCAMLFWLLGKPQLYIGTLKAHSVASQAMVQFMHSVVRK